mmetsp:Transcript_27683/g.79900  ORF Transcript_27683/g.79900 Transcript_27683/m.79900 type:complete len:225 (-) Transcript_27683:267-941(-)
MSVPGESASSRRVKSRYRIAVKTRNATTTILAQRTLAATASVSTPLSMAAPCAATGSARLEKIPATVPPTVHALMTPRAGMMPMALPTVVPGTLLEAVALVLAMTTQTLELRQIKPVAYVEEANLRQGGHLQPHPLLPIPATPVPARTEASVSAQVRASHATAPTPASTARSAKPTSTNALTIHAMPTPTVPTRMEAIPVLVMLGTQEMAPLAAQLSAEPTRRS